jgi:osmotically inducible lipoprotein OsmB
VKRTTVASFLLVTLAASGCAGLSETEQRTLTGGAGGAAAGAVIGALAGNAALGAAIGGAAGAGGGFLYGRGVEEGQRRR